MFCFVFSCRAPNEKTLWFQQLFRPHLLGGGGGGREEELYNQLFFFVQSILADRYIQSFASFEELLRFILLCEKVIFDMILFTFWRNFCSN